MCSPAQKTVLSSVHQMIMKSTCASCGSAPHYGGPLTCHYAASTCPHVIVPCWHLRAASSCTSTFSLMCPCGGSTCGMTSCKMSHVTCLETCSLAPGGSSIAWLVYTCTWHKLGGPLACTRTPLKMRTQHVDLRRTRKPACLCMRAHAHLRTEHGARSTAQHGAQHTHAAREHMCTHAPPCTLKGGVPSLEEGVPHVLRHLAIHQARDLELEIGRGGWCC